MSDEHVRFKYTGSALPGNAETVIILATAPTSGSFTGVIAGPGNIGHFFQTSKIRRVVLALVNDQAGTLKEYKSMDRGATWLQINPDIAVAASAANSENIYDFWVEPYVDWKLAWTNGAAAQTAFSPDIVGVGQRVIAS